MTTSELIADVSKKIQDPTNVHVSQGEIVTWLNQGLKLIASLMPSDALIALSKTSSLTRVSAREFTLPTDYMRYKACLLSDVGCNKVDASEVGMTKNSWLAPSGNYPYIYIWEGAARTLHDTEVTDTCQLFHLRYPAALAIAQGDAVPEIPDFTHAWLSDYATGRAFLKMNDSERGIGFLNLVNESINTYVNAHKAMFGDEPISEEIFQEQLSGAGGNIRPPRRRRPLPRRNPPGPEIPEPIPEPRW